MYRKIKYPLSNTFCQMHCKQLYDLEPKLAVKISSSVSKIFHENVLKWKDCVQQNVLNLISITNAARIELLEHNFVVKVVKLPFLSFLNYIFRIKQEQDNLIFKVKLFWEKERKRERKYQLIN